MKREKIFFSSGVVFLILALFSVTFLPLILKHLGIYFLDYVFIRLEFVLLLICSILYHFSPKYYDLEIFSVLVGILYYIFFIKIVF